MANINAPHGARLIGRTDSGLGLPSVNPYQKAASHGTAIFAGDIVNAVADTTIEPGGTPGTTIFARVSLNHGAASKLTTHYVVDDPEAIFEMQASGSIVAADLNLNANFLFTTAGSALTKQSGHMIDHSTKATSAGLDARLLRKYALPADINDWGSYVILEIKFNARHIRRAGTAGV